MKLIICLVIFCVANAHGIENIASAQEMARFQALRSAKTLGEFEALRRRFDLRDAAMSACRRELDQQLLPVNCYVILKIDGHDRNIRSNFSLSTRELANKCEKSAAFAQVMPRSEQFRLLPTKCAQKTLERGKLLSYKAGKEFE